MFNAVSIASAEEIVLKSAHNAFEGHPFHDGNLALQEALESKTNGAVKVQIFPNSQLGAEDQVVELLNHGTIAFTIAGASGLAGFVPQTELLNLPFIFKDLDHFYRVVDGPVGNRMSQAIEDKLNVVVLGWMYSGSRNLWNSKHPVLSPADMSGLKIRTMTSSVMVDSFNALGGQATPIAFSELYTALQQGVVDGAEGDHIDLLGEKFHETVKYVSLTGHIYFAGALLMSKDAYDGLSFSQQTAVWEAAEDAIKAERASYSGKDQAAEKELRKLGVEFSDVDASIFQDALKDVYTKYGEKLGGVELIEQIARQ